MPQKTYAEIQEQIAKLQREAEEVREAEVAEVVEKINKAIEVYGLQPGDLTFPAAKVRAAASPGGRPARAKRRTSKVASKTGAEGPKYRDQHGNTWVGRGPRPQWLRDALASGGSLADFLA